MNLDVFRCPLAGVNLIEASAGTGKTWNICGLYLRLLLERGLEVQRVLVVTFTNAATAELRERIRGRIVEVLGWLRRPHAGPADPFIDGLIASLQEAGHFDAALLERRLDLALQTFDEASIFTIHGFCQRALSDAPFTAQMPLSLELVPDDAELLHQVAADAWRRSVAAPGLSPLLAAQLVRCKDSPERWAALLERRLAKPMSTVLWPPELDDAQITDEATIAKALADAHAHARTLWHAQRAGIVQAVTEALPRLNGVTYKPTAVEGATAAWDEVLQPADALAALSNEPRYLDLLGAARLQERTKKGQQPPSHAFFDAAQALLDERARASQAMTLARLSLLRRLLDEGAEAVRAHKRERRVIAFDDMLFNLHERLSGPHGPALAAALRLRFPAALIDEFQDTDPLQFSIFRTLYGSHAGAGGQAEALPLFLVGDPKQAIYSFRHADLHTYLQARDEAGAEYTLADNQRSAKPLIDALNALFGHNPRAFMLKGLDYEPVNFGAKPRPPFDDRSAPRAALQCWSLPRDDEGEPLPKPDALAASAHACAAETARLLRASLAGEVAIGGRPLAAGDIAVLVRSHAQGSRVRQALAALGVGSVELSQASVFHGPDAEAMEWLLAAVLEPTRERRLRAALATEWMGCSAAQIDAISADENRLLALVNRFAGYRDTWLARGAGVMLRDWMQAERVAERLLARPDGERRLTNLLHLAELLHAAAEQHTAPPALLQWLQRQRAAGSADDAAQLRLESDRNLVQIVTIHKSKGLEYPVVFCPFLWDGAPAKDNGASADAIEYHDGAGQPVLDFRQHTPPELEAIKQQRRHEAGAEFLRLVYVALTRAVHRCYLVTGAYRKGGSATESTRSLLNWLVAGAGLDPAEWAQHKQGAEQVDAAWQAWAAALQAGGRDAYTSTGAANTIALPAADCCPLPTEPGLPVPPAVTDADALSALVPPPRLPPGWRIGSYSSLALGARHETAAADHDLRAEPAGTDPLRAAPPARLADDDVLRFPRGAAAGDAMHALLERTDFASPAGWPAAIAQALAQHPQPAGAQPLAPMLQRLLADLSQVTLPGGFTLADVSPARRLVELEFTLPSPGLGAGALAGTLRSLGYPAPALAFGALEGYLRGFIDLVFEHGGRYYVLDWKSNHLGDTAADYRANALQEAMAQHHYHLQYLLYSVALQRYLRARVPGYSHADHFGGVYYLFVRGVRPGWRQPDGSPAGVVFDRPSEATLQRLSALFGSEAMA